MPYTAFSGSTGSVGSLNAMLQQLFLLRELFSDPGYTGATPRVSIDGFGNYLFTSGANFGYGAGGGGAVTQATSKTTSVTLNKPSGQITLNAASLAAGATVGFTVLNATVAANDVVICHRLSGGTNGAYQVWVDRVAGGGFDIYIRNLTGGALAEAVVLQFAVVRGSVS